MQTIGSIFLIFVGAGLLVVAWRGHREGELPGGSAGLRAYRPRRTDNPVAFRFRLALYACGGLALAVWGLLALIGLAPPLPLR